MWTRDHGSHPGGVSEVMTRGVRKMSAAIGMFVIAGVAIGSFLIPPHHLIKTKRARAQLPADPVGSAVHEETR
jgi:hypothetical protein